MTRRLGAVLAIVAISAVAVGDAHALKKGGIFRVGTTGASVQVDPQLAYITTAWWLEYATAAKLFNYPDRSGQAGALLRPEVASRYAVSKDGKTYTFRIRKGFRFSDGKPVTARNFKYAFQRVANERLGSPGAGFIMNPDGTPLVRAVTARGDKLTIRLTRADGAFLSKLAMPFFQATSLKLPLDQEVTTGYPSAGPYYYSRNDVNQLTSIRQNRFWRRGPGRHRPRNLDGVDIRWNLDEQTAFTQVLANQLDEGPLPAAEVERVAEQFGVNRTRFWTKPASCIGSIPFNNATGLFAGNPAMRKAVNWALDRRNYVRQAGPYAGRPWTHILLPITAGSVTTKKRQPYTPGPNIAKARRLAAGHFRNGKIVVAYRSSGTTNPAQAQIVKSDLIRLGFNEGNIQMRGYSGGQIYDALGVSGNDIDMAVSMGWCGSLDAHTDLKAVIDSSLSFATYAKKLARANRLKGNARLRALGRLDLEIMRNAAPLAPMRTYNNRYFFSTRVDPRSLVYQVAYTDWSIPALALK